MLFLQDKFYGEVTEFNVIVIKLTSGNQYYISYMTYFGFFKFGKVT